MFYSKIGLKSQGFTNQIFAFITSIIIAHKNNDKVVVVDKFLNDFSKDNYTPISEIFDIDKINIFLKNTYDIIIIDKHNVKLEINSIKYGTREKNIDLTDSILKSQNQQYFYRNNILYVNKNTDMNQIQGDPCILVKKQIFLNYTINNYTIEEVHEENLVNNISINILHSTYQNNFAWINSYDMNMFENILLNIFYHNDFIEKSNIIFNEINTNDKINVIHLRVEDDAINHWSNMNKMNKNMFKTHIENKYIGLIQKYISKTDQNIILSSSLNNKVINYLNQNNYNYKFNNKYFEDREKNAIVDLLTSSKCNNIFIGNFNIENLNGSTFSYYIGKIVNNNVKKIYIDLDKIHDVEVVI